MPELTVENIAKWLTDNRHRVAVVVNDDHEVFEIKRVIHAIENKSQGESLLIAIQPVRTALAAKGSVCEDAVKRPMAVAIATGELYRTLEELDSLRDKLERIAESFNAALAAQERG